MNITIVSVGKIKEDYLKAGIDEYLKRLSRYCRINIIELDDEKVPDRLSDRELEIIQKAEGDRIKSVIKPGWYTIALDSKGKHFTSVEFASKIESLAVSGQSNLAFVIGGTTGLSRDILDSSHLILSFSKLTFSHQMIRLFLLEQLFRCYKINKGETYHR